MVMLPFSPDALSLAPGTRFLRLSGAIFLVVAAVWGSLVALGEVSSILVTPGVISLFSGIFLTVKVRRYAVQSLAVSTALLNMLIFGFLFYSAIGLLQTGLLLLFAIASALVYFLGAGVFLLLTLAILARPEYFRSLRTPSAEKGKMSGMR